MINAHKYDIMDENGQRTQLYSFVPPKKGDDEMEWQEKYIDKLNQDVSDIRTEMQGIRSEMRDMRQELKTEIREMRQEINATLDRALTEMRDRDNQRHQEILAIQNRIDANVASLKTEISGVKSEMSTTKKWIIGLTVAAGLSFLGIATALSFGMLNVVNIVNSLVGK